MRVPRTPLKTSGNTPTAGRPKALVSHGLAEKAAPAVRRSPSQTSLTLADTEVGVRRHCLSARWNLPSWVAALHCISYKINSATVCCRTPRFENYVRFGGQVHTDSPPCLQKLSKVGVHRDMFADTPTGNTD